ncbi:MAG: hypothetical protein ABL956_10825 [Hyphomonadaceae bacterium]
MLSRRIAVLEIKLRRREPLPLWAILTRERSDPFAARAALTARAKGSPLSEADAIELARLQRVIEDYETDMAL